MTPRIVCAGVTGLIGQPLTQKLSEKHEIIYLKRKDFVEGGWAKMVDGAEAVINLSGESIAGKRWTPAQKKRLRDSRLDTTRELVKAIGQAKIKPKVFLNASAVGFYGDRCDESLDENSQKGRGFLPDLCSQWEAEASPAKALGVRTVYLRTGIVLAKNGGALAKMVPPFKFFMGGPLGSGKQWLSWIHIEDEVNAIIHCLENASLDGPVNLTAPKPVTMTEFARTLGKVLHRPSWAPVPAAALKLLLGEMSEMLLTGQKVIPQKLLNSNFRFSCPSLQEALLHLLTQ